MAIGLRPILVGAVVGKKPSDPLVVDSDGKTPTRQRLYNAFVALQVRLKIAPTWSFHSLRHSFGTTAIRAGANVEAVRELMGHRDLTTTARYLHALADDRNAVIAALDGQL